MNGAPSQISAAAINQAFAFLGFDNPASILEARFENGTFAVVRVVCDDEGEAVARGGNLVYEQCTYTLE